MSRTLAVLGAILLFATSCGSQPEVESSPGPLSQAFSRSAGRYGVPENLLKAIAQTETQFFHQPYLRSIDGGFGLMHLVEGRTLARAARLTGLTEEELEGSAEANIEGAAAVLRSFFDESLANNSTLDSRDPVDYLDAVRAYSGIPDPDLSLDHALQVYAALTNGARRDLGTEVVVLEPTPIDLSRRLPLGSARFALTPDYTQAGWRPASSSNFAVGRTAAIDTVVIHTTQGTYAGTISWFQDPAAQVSSHFVVPRTAMTPALTQMVQVQDTAWHASSYNSRAVGVEHEGYVADPAWATENTYCVSAQLVSWLCSQHGFPCDRSHILGHSEVPGATHTDPGPNWDWTKYMGYVSGGCGAAGTTGTLIGVVYAAPTTANRIAGAKVTLNNGQSQVVGADGVYRFTLPGGSYTATASATGYTSSSVTRTVTVGATTWGSIGMTAAGAATGTYRGVVYEVNPTNAADTSKVLAGATVSLETGATATTGADGAFSFTAAPGVHTASASLAGYLGNSSTATVVANAEVWGSIGLSKQAVATPVVKITNPADGAQLDFAHLQVEGQVSQAQGATEVQVIYAGKMAAGPLTNAAFSVPIDVPAGDTGIQVSVTNGAGTGTASVVVHFKTGLCGNAYETTSTPGDRSRPLSGASAELLGGDLCGAPGTAATTDLAGHFCLDAAPGDYTLRIRLSGERTDLERVTIPADRRLQTESWLVRGADLGPSISIASPTPDANGEVVGDQYSVTLRGTIEGMVASELTINGQHVALTDGGGFTTTVGLGVGETTIELVAQGSCGEEARRTLSARRSSDPPTTAKSSGCGCASGGQSSLLLLGLPALAVFGRRRRAF